MNLPCWRIDIGLHARREADRCVRVRRRVLERAALTSNRLGFRLPARLLHLIAASLSLASDGQRSFYMSFVQRPPRLPTLFLRTADAHQRALSTFALTMGRTTMRPPLSAAMVSKSCALLNVAVGD